jgi:hypothetical protein
MSALAGVLRASHWGKDESQLAADWRAAAFEELPGLSIAFDGREMAERVIPALLGTSRSRYSTRLGDPGYVIYIPGDSCTLRYVLDVRDLSSGGSSTHLVTARIFAEPSSSASYFHRQVTSVARAAAGRPDLQPLRRPAAVLKEIATTVSVFPVDGDLPTLVEATDPVQMLGIFNRAPLGRASAGREVVACRVHRGHYGRRHRCVLRYEIDVRPSPRALVEQRVVFGKVTSDGRSAVGDAAISSLRASMPTGSKLGLTVPRSLGFYPRLRLALTEAMPGEPEIGRLVTSRLLGTEHRGHAGITLEESIDAAGRAAAGLHMWHPSFGPRRSLADETRSLGMMIETLHHAVPELAARLSQVVSEVERRAESSRALDSCLCHGDFSHTQLLFEGSACSLVDFDTICRAEPALDLGHFLAYLRLALSKSQASARLDDVLYTDLSDRFLDAYARASAKRALDVGQLRARSGLYEVLSLVRLAVHSWQKLKMTRLLRLMTLLDQGSS